MIYIYYTAKVYRGVELLFWQLAGSFRGVMTPEASKEADVAEPQIVFPPEEQRRMVAEDWGPLGVEF